jgi:hypothetical protein
MTNKPYLHFDGMTWPNPADPLGVEYRLRYGTPSRSDLMVAASFVAAYRQLVDDPVRRREAKIRGIRIAHNALFTEVPAVGGVR